MPVTVRAGVPDVAAKSSGQLVECGSGCACGCRMWWLVTGSCVGGESVSVGVTIAAAVWWWVLLLATAGLLHGVPVMVR